ncbi:MAG: sulfatase-like hydrolase/transferase, partial [Verrucomicrobiota bacterium]
YWDLFDPNSISLPTPPLAPENVPEIAVHESREIRGYGLTATDRPFTEEETRRYRHGYYASITFMDAQIGEILDGLADGGHLEDTIIVFTSDHGFHIGEHALWGKTSNFELDARVPLIIADPRNPESHGSNTDALAELVDLYPTLAELTGTRQNLPENLEGVSLGPVLADPGSIVKDAAFTQHQQPFYGPESNWKAWGYSARSDRWRYTEWRSIETGGIIARELYDHENDPAESVNVAAQHPKVVAREATRLTKLFPISE